MITLESLGKTYGPKHAVDNLDAGIQPGKVTGFLGPNGAGKSTTMRLILGLDRPTRGRALVNGVPYRDLEHPLRTVGAHINTTAGHPGRTPVSHLRALAYSNGIEATRVGVVLEQTGLSSVAHQRIRGFSLGMRQRLGIASALLGDPKILILDEPMNGLDAEGISWIRGLMRERARAGGTVFVSSHLMSEVQQVADELILIGRGELITQAPMAQLLEDYSRPRILVKSPQAEALAELARGHGYSVSSGTGGRLEVSGATLAQFGSLAFHAGIELHELSSAGTSLESIYTQLTRDAVEYAAQPEETVQSR
ncbi:ATP-binding cassette domain-containing protein [Glutamicibacter soli]|uniref:ATP-binding cassette domain-containing protein n=1 Tax=Glutamicibacter soli TaxID=453836 RepID=A0A6L9G715_9MICC|nr:ATP-binding cassette domain-containing protein [Glutamicibacter soli]NAZ16753.1 ATP-binding cassette domain-containing protein [Glutamicibacter soli]